MTMMINDECTVNALNATILLGCIFRATHDGCCECTTAGIRFLVLYDILLTVRVNTTSAALNPACASEYLSNLII